jgi:hypothetical protein
VRCLHRCSQEKFLGGNTPLAENKDFVDTKRINGVSKRPANGSGKALRRHVRAGMWIDPLHRVPNSGRVGEDIGSMVVRG